MFRKMRRSAQEVPAEACEKVLSAAKRGVLSVIGDDGYPYGIPVNFYYDPEAREIYFHGAKEGHKVDAIKANDKVCFTAWDEGFKKDGDWAWNVTSVVSFGRAYFVDDEAERIRILNALGDKYYPDGEDVQKEIVSAGGRALITAVRIESMTGKLVNEK